MNTEITNEMQRIATAARTLHNIAGAVSEHLLAIQNSLNDFNLGFEAWVPIDADDDNLPQTRPIAEIGYAEHDGRWQLRYRFRFDDDAILDSRLSVRLRAAAALPRLLEKLAAQAELAFSEHGGSFSHLRPCAALLSQVLRSYNSGLQPYGR